MTAFESKGGRLTLPKEALGGGTSGSEDESDVAYAEEKKDKILPLNEQPRASLTKSLTQRAS